jgi:hypothetical protein
MNLAATPCFIGYGAAANNGALVLFRSRFDFFLVLFAENFGWRIPHAARAMRGFNKTSYSFHRGVTQFWKVPRGALSPLTSRHRPHYFSHMQQGGNHAFAKNPGSGIGPRFIGRRRQRRRRGQ